MMTRVVATIAAIFFEDKISVGLVLEVDEAGDSVLLELREMIG